MEPTRYLECGKSVAARVESLVLCCVAATGVGLTVGPAPAGTPRPVVAYVALDEPYARPVLERFTRETGVKVTPLYDTEAAKSRGLAARIRAERRRPRADVFWSNEVLQMAGLERAGCLAGYRPRSAAGIPPEFRSPGGFWTGFAARFRVLAYRSDRVKRPPRSLRDLALPEWRGQVAMANPLFGTTTTEAAALAQLWGEAEARRYFESRRANGTRVVDGNSVTADMVLRGEVLIGQTDTDDAFVRRDRDPRVTLLYPGQGPDGEGALMVPNTAALLAGAPNAAGGKRLLEFLLQPSTELLLSRQKSRQLPLNQVLARELPAEVRALASVRRMKVDYNRLADAPERLEGMLREIFLR